MTKVMRIIVQVGLLWGVALIGDGIAHFIHNIVPGSIIGLILLFGLLSTKVVRVEWFRQGSAFLIGEMLLFFVPTSVGVMQYGHLLSIDGWRFLLAISASALSVMLVSGLIAEFIVRKRGRMQNDKGDSAAR